MYGVLDRVGHGCHQAVYDAWVLPARHAAVYAAYLVGVVAYLLEYYALGVS